MFPLFSSKKKYRPNVGVIVTDGNGRVLLCRRMSDSTNVQGVQGGIDPGETAEQAARREIKEEIGLDADQYEFKARLLETFRYDWPEEMINNRDDYIGQEQTYFLIEVDPDVKFDLDYHHREFKKVWWGTPEELVKKAWPPKRPIFKAVLKGFDLLD